MLQQEVPPAPDAERDERRVRDARAVARQEKAIEKDARQQEAERVRRSMADMD